MTFMKLFKTNLKDAEKELKSSTDTTENYNYKSTLFYLQIKNK